MKKLSITIASAALITVSFPLTSGCNSSSSPPQAQAPNAQQPATTGLKPVAIPPTLRAVSFNDDLFGPPPSPQLRGDASGSVQVAEEAARRMVAEADLRKQAEVTSLPPTTDTQLLGEQSMPTGEIPPLRFPKSDPSALSGADFDYRAGIEPSARQPRVADAPPAEGPTHEVSAQPPLPETLEIPATNDQSGSDSPASEETFTLAPPANSPAAQPPSKVSLDSKWQSVGDSDSRATSTPAYQPEELSQQQTSGPLATPVPVPAPVSEPAVVNPPPQVTHQEAESQLKPSEQSVPTLADTREWSSQQQHSQPQTLSAATTDRSAPTPQPVAPQYTQQVEGPQLLSTPPAQPMEPVAVEPLQLPLASEVDMQVVEHHARMLIDRGTQLGGRGALYSAKVDFMHAIRLIAEAQDSIAGDRRHSEALARAWSALEEAEDFAPGGIHSVDMQQIVPSHRTTILQQAELSRLTPLEATQKYFAYAQEQLALAGGDQPVAAEALYSLGKTHGFIARESNRAARTNGPMALAMQQAALMIDPTHDGAANELGVLLAKYGQWNDARRVLLHAVSMRPSAEKWHNLAVVHEHLGESKLAQLATEEAELAVRQSRQHGMPADERVRWVSPDQFESNTVARGTLPTAAPVRSTAEPPQQPPTPATDTAWKWPWFK